MAISKSQNLKNLEKIHADLGWRLLMNEHVVLEKGGEEIALIGIENWSAKADFLNMAIWPKPMPAQKNILLKF